MPKMIRFRSGGMVNLDHVARVNLVTKKRDRKSGAAWDTETTFHSPDGEIIATSSMDESEEIEAACAHYVAASPGAEIIAIDFYRNDEGRPTRQDVNVERWPIVAWRMMPGIGSDQPQASPVTVESWGAMEWLIPLPDGRICSPGDCTYTNLDRAIEDRLERAQRDWDNKQAIQAANKREAMNG